MHGHNPIIEFAPERLREMHRAYLDPWRTPDEVAAAYYISRVTMLNRFHEAGLPTRTQWRTSREFADEVYRMYLEQGVMRTALAYNMTHENVHQILRRHGLPSHKQRRELGLE